MDHAVAQDYRADWNTQPMCKECNNIGKHGQMVGFPVFECQCHFLQIDKTGDMFVYETTGMDTNIHLFLENIVEPHTSVALASWRVIPRNSPGKGSQG